MAKIASEKVVNELKFVKVVTSRYWQLLWPFDKAFPQSQTLLGWSMTADWSLF